MKKFIAALLATIFCYTATAQHTKQLVEVEVDGAVRRALVMVPEGRDKPQPLIFVFHGRKGTMDGAAKRMAIHEYYNDAIAVYPQGMWMDSGRFEGFGWVMPDAEDEGRDMRFFDALFERLVSDYNIDSNRVYAMGHSNGGGFTHALWALRGDKFAAFAISASGAVRLGELIERQSAKPLFFIAGEADDIVPLHLVHKHIDRTIVRNGCHRDKSQNLSPYQTLYPSKSGNDVVTYIHNGNHRFCQEALPLIADFFEQNIRAARF